MMNKIKKGFISFLCILFVSIIWADGALERSQGGAELNGFLAFVLWCVSVYIIIKGKAILSTVGSFGIMYAIRIQKFGTTKEALGNMGVVLYCVIVLGMIWVMWRMLFWGVGKSNRSNNVSRERDSDYRREERERRKRENLERLERQSEEIRQRQIDEENRWREEQRREANSLKSGSDEYWKLEEQAEYIYRQAADARNSDERRRWAERGKNLAYRMREKYGLSDEVVERLISNYYLDRL